jgi:lipoprotein-anchoring transpeptidase ErfK/SrfK
MTAGHVFLTHGDLTTLACDALLVPTDAQRAVDEPWRGAMRGEAPAAPRNWHDNAVRAQLGVPRTESDPATWLVNVGSAPGRPLTWYLEGVRQFVAGAAAERSATPCASCARVSTGLPAGRRPGGEWNASCRVWVAKKKRSKPAGWNAACLFVDHVVDTSTISSSSHARRSVRARPFHRGPLRAAGARGQAPSDSRPERAQFSQQLALQVALDRAGYSPGEIDGRDGPNTRGALEAYRQGRGSAPVAGNGNEGAAPVSADLTIEQSTTSYVITPEDTAGPFVDRIPADLMEQSKLETLAYTSVVELLAERFHASPALLRQLNPGAGFTEGATLIVPNVEPFYLPKERGKRPSPSAPAPTAQTGASANTAGNTNARDARPMRGKSGERSAPSTGTRITITKGTNALLVEGETGNVMFRAPVTVGSERDPLPLGRWKVTGVIMNPVFHYNPDLFWDADPTHSKADIPAGPNNPVGPVWIGISKEHYGIHGTPEPSRIGRTQSHGCIRLTNWDIVRLASLVGDGTEVIFQ